MLRFFAMLLHAVSSFTRSCGILRIVRSTEHRNDHRCLFVRHLAVSYLALLFVASYSIQSHAVVFNDNLPSTPNFNYEHELLQQHQQLVERYTANYDQLQISKQPANKTEQCTVSSELLDGFLDNTSLLFWEGSCQNGKAEGFGRVYVIQRGQKVFEMLTNFHSDEPQFTTTYYSKNTLVNSQTVFFYGKATRYHSSGVTITKRTVNDDLVVAMQTIDKVNFITYQKETSLNSPYVLNVADFGNHTHYIYDLNSSPYRSLFMAYKMVDNTRNHNIGYSFAGKSDGTLQGTFTNNINKSSPIEIPPQEIQHIINTNEVIEVNIENSIKNVIEALVVVDAYLNVICADTYQNPVCSKMECKLICDLNSTITPDHQKVKELLLRLADHHNRRPVKKYLEAILQAEVNPQAPAQIPESSAPAPEESYNINIPLGHINMEQSNSAAPAATPNAAEDAAASATAPASNASSANSREHTQQALSYDSAELRRQALQLQQNQVEQQLEQKQQQTQMQIPQFRARETMLRDMPNNPPEQNTSGTIKMPQRGQNSSQQNPEQFVPKDLVHSRDDLTESELQRRQEIIEQNHPQP